MAKKKKRKPVRNVWGGNSNDYLKASLGFAGTAVGISAASAAIKAMNP